MKRVLKSDGKGNSYERSWDFHEKSDNDDTTFNSLVYSNIGKFIYHSTRIQESENPHISAQHVWVSPQLNPSILRCDIPVVYKLQCRSKCEQQSKTQLVVFMTVVHAYLYISPSMQCLSTWKYHDRRTLPRYVDRVAATPTITRQENFHVTAGWGSDAFSCSGTTGSEWQPGLATYDDPAWLRWSPR